MTSETPRATRSNGHIHDLALRRFWAGDLGGPERPGIEAHATVCARCRVRLKEFADEQRRFEQEISFDRFAAGVERAARTPRRIPARSNPTARWAFPALSLAAALALTITFAPRLRPGGESNRGESNRIKGGGGGITVQIAAPGAGPQRAAAIDAPETLSPGERIRIGYQPGRHRYLTSLSIDEQGDVTALYPEAGHSLAVGKAAPAATRYLPDSVEFTGEGRERLIVVLSDQPLDVDAVKKAARAAYQKAGGDLARLSPLDLPGEQFQRTFVKP
jgi:Domain of unknown function (DUF4384)